MKDKKNTPYHDDFDDQFDIEKTVASSTECTGLIQTPPGTDDEAEAYTQLYAIHKTSKNTTKKP